MTILVLGGTSDGRRIADALHVAGLPVLYSVAGLVRPPKVLCEYISGGFTQYGGLANYLRTHCIKAILDATHPYATRISESAKIACDDNKIPCFRFLRKPWQETPSIAANIKPWAYVYDWQETLEALTHYKRPLLTTGQLPPEVMATLGSMDLSPVLRTAVKPNGAIPDNITWIKAIGPFDVEHERALFISNNIDVLVSKNSGGEATMAKLGVAEELKTPVIMFERPTKALVEHEYDDLDACRRFCIDWYESTHNKNSFIPNSGI